MNTQVVNCVIEAPEEDNIVLRPGEPSAGPPGMLGRRSLKRLMDFLFLSPHQVMLSERVFAESLILQNFDHIPDETLVRLACRLAGSNGVAPDLTAKLAHCGRPNFSTIVLEDAQLNDADIAEIAREGTLDERLAISRRANLSSIVSAILIDQAEDEVMRSLLANQSACLSRKTLDGLIVTAKRNRSIQNAILVRPEISAPAAMDLFWHVPGEIREYILLTYLCDQLSLTGIFFDDVSWQASQKSLRPGKDGDANVKTLTKLLLAGEVETAANVLSQKAGITLPTAQRILQDSGGEAFLVAAKATGASRAGLNQALMRFINAKATPCLIGSVERLDCLRNLFDKMSRGQAQVALQYWNLQPAMAKSEDEEPPDSKLASP